MRNPPVEDFREERPARGRAVGRARPGRASAMLPDQGGLSPDAESPRRSHRWVGNLPTHHRKHRQIAHPKIVPVSARVATQFNVSLLPIEHWQIQAPELTLPKQSLALYVVERVVAYMPTLNMLIRSRFG